MVNLQLCEYMYGSSLRNQKFKGTTLHYSALLIINSICSIVFFHLQIVVDNDDEKEWWIYDTGSSHVWCPLVCLFPANSYSLKSWLQGDICKFHNLNKSFTINTSPQISTALE